MEIYIKKIRKKKFGKIKKKSKKTFDKIKFQATILQQTAEYIEKLEREKKQMRQLLQAQNPSFKNSEIMILPNSDSEKEVKEETYSSGNNTGATY